MRRNENYALTYLVGVPYLLPYGQMLAGHRRSIRLNSTSAAIWELLEQPQELSGLVSAMAQAYRVPEEGVPQLQQDISLFISRLSSLEIIEDIPSSLAEEVPAENICEATAFPEFSGSVRYLRIAGLTLRLCGPEEVFSQDFDLFAIPEGATDTYTIDQVIYVTGENPPQPEGSVCLLRDQQLCIYEAKDAYRLAFPLSRKLQGACIAKDAGRVVFYVSLPYTGSLVYELFHAIRTSFLYLAGQHRMFAIHSASIFYKGKAWLFSGPSGTGKSSHTNLWKDHFATPVVNGDLNLLALRDGKPAIYGIPWCGTSKICDSASYRLGGIVHLKQMDSNQLIPLSEDQKQLFTLQRLVSPLWTREMLQTAVSFIAELSASVSTFQLGCTLSREAVLTIKNAIDIL